MSLLKGFRAQAGDVRDDGLVESPECEDPDALNDPEEGDESPECEDPVTLNDPEEGDDDAAPDEVACSVIVSK